jgi:hypothetical protein
MLDKQVTKALGWDSHHQFCSTPIWMHTMLAALPDMISMSRVQEEWIVTHEEITVTGWTLPIALGRLICTLDILEKEGK